MSYADLIEGPPDEDVLFKSSVVVKALLVPGDAEVSDRVLVYSEDQSICFETQVMSILGLFQPGEQSIYLRASWHSDTSRLVIYRGRAGAQDW